MREMARFAVGLIPFRRNTLTESVDPVKYYEYRAMGIPVLSTGFGEMPAHAQEDSGVVLTQAGQDPAKMLARALAWTQPPSDSTAFRVANAWQARFQGAAQRQVREAARA